MHCHQSDLKASTLTAHSRNCLLQSCEDKKITNLLDNAIFSPTSVQTGAVKPILAKSALTAMTLPPVLKLPMFTINTSFLVSFATFAPFLSPKKLS